MTSPALFEPQSCLCCGRQSWKRSICYVLTGGILTADVRWLVTFLGLGASCLFATPNVEGYWKGFIQTESKVLYGRLDHDPAKEEPIAIYCRIEQVEGKIVGFYVYGLEARVDAEQFKGKMPRDVRGLFGTVNGEEITIRLKKKDKQAEDDIICTLSFEKNTLKGVFKRRDWAASTVRKYDYYGVVDLAKY